MMLPDEIYPIYVFDMYQLKRIFIGPESWLCLSLTHSLTHSLTPYRLVNFIDVTLACEDANSKLIEVVTVVDVDAQNQVDDSLVQIWKLKFGHKINFFVHTLNTRFGQDFEVEAQARF